MAEQVKSITDARQGLPGLSRNAGERMERYIITQQGQPQSVLLGYKDYLGMVAAVELLHQPAALANLHRGLEQLHEGAGLTFEQMEAAVERAEANELEAHGEEQDVSSFSPGADPLQGTEMMLEKAIRKTIEIPEFGNIEVILTRTVGRGNEVSNIDRWAASVQRAEQRGASKTRASMTHGEAGSDVLKTNE